MSDDDDDPPSLSYCEPQLKKARYLWQIKGRAQKLDDQPCCSRDISPSEDVPSMVDRSKEDRCKVAVAWGAQRMVKALFDNTINTMIENMSVPLPEMGNIIEGYANHRSNINLEDQAVRMAIRHHGIQKPCSCARQRPIPHVPCYIPFHHRTDSSLFDGPSTSNVSLRQQDLVEQDILSEAVNVAILNKGLRASSHGGINI